MPFDRDVAPDTVHARLWEQLSSPAVHRNVPFALSAAGLGGRGAGALIRIRFSQNSTPRS